MSILDVPPAPLPTELVRSEVNLPELSELEVVRHYIRLSRMNFCIDTHFYPLGSSTMKYNPKVNEAAAAKEGFSRSHPRQPETLAQGNLELMFRLQEMLKEITGFGGVSLEPADGAQAELAGVLMMRAYHAERGDRRRTKILISDSTHGTNPASAAMGGFQVGELPSDERGNIDLVALKAACDESVAGLMVTVPNILGLFDENIVAVVDTVHRWAAWFTQTGLT